MVQNSPTSSSSSSSSPYSGVPAGANDFIWHKPPEYYLKKLKKAEHWSKGWVSAQSTVGKAAACFVVSNGRRETRIPMRDVTGFGRCLVEKEESLCYRDAAGHIEYRYGNLAWFLAAGSRVWTFAAGSDDIAEQWMQWVRQYARHTSIDPKDPALRGVPTVKPVERLTSEGTVALPREKEEEPPATTPLFRGRGRGALFHSGGPGTIAFTPWKGEGRGGVVGGGRQHISVTRGFSTSSSSSAATTSSYHTPSQPGGAYRIIMFDSPDAQSELSNSPLSNAHLTSSADVTAVPLSATPRSVYM